MKSAKAFLTGLFVLFAIGACEKDALNTEEAYLKASAEKMEEIKMVPFKGNFVSRPASEELIACAEPGTDPFMGPKFNLVSGNATHLGIMDQPNSPLTIESCSFNATTGILTVTLDITFKNKNGWGIQYQCSWSGLRQLRCRRWLWKISRSYRVHNHNRLLQCRDGGCRI